MRGLHALSAEKDHSGHFIYYISNIEVLDESFRPMHRLK